MFQTPIYNNIPFYVWPPFACLVCVYVCSPLQKSRRCERRHDPNNTHTHTQTHEIMNAHAGYARARILEHARAQASARPTCLRRDAFVYFVWRRRRRSSSAAAICVIHCARSRPRVISSAPIQSASNAHKKRMRPSVVFFLRARECFCFGQYTHQHARLAILESHARSGERARAQARK